MSERHAPQTFKDLMAATGSFIFYWSSFELALARAIREMRMSAGEEDKPVKGGLAERLDLWLDLMLPRLPGSSEQAVAARALRNQALQLRELRNLIVHGVVNGDSRPVSGEPAHISCIVGGFDAPTGELRRITLEQLEHYMQATDACLRGCKDPSTFNYRL